MRNHFTVPNPSAFRTAAARAFSLIELSFVIGTIAIVSAIAVPRFAGSLQQQRVSAAAQRIVADLNMARSRANTTSTTIAVTFTFATNQYDIPAIPDLDKPLNGYSVRLGDEPYSATLVSSSLGGSLQTSGTSQISFTGYGLPNTGGTIIVAAGNATRQVLVDGVSGRAVVK